MHSLKDRLAAAFDPSKHTQAELSRAAKVSTASVSDWFSGETKTLKAEPLLRAAAYLGVSPFWLALGEGPMRTNSHSPTVVMAREAAPPYSAWPSAGLHIEQVHAMLTEAQRAEVSGMIRAFLSENARSGLPSRPAQTYLAPPQSTHSTGGEDTPEWGPTLHKTA